MESRPRNVQRLHVSTAATSRLFVEASARYANRAIVESQVLQDSDKLSQIPTGEFAQFENPWAEYKALHESSSKAMGLWFIQSLYQSFDTYIRQILREVFESDSELVLSLFDGEATIAYSELVSLGNYSEICNRLVSDLYRKLEGERSTRKLLEKIIKRMKLEIDEPLLQNGLSTLELRHLIVHNRATIDESYERTFPTRELKNKELIPTDERFLSGLQRDLDSLIHQIDKELLDRKIVKEI